MDSLRWHGRGGMAEACLGRERVAVERTLVRCEGATKRRHVVRLVVTRTSCDVFDTLNQNRGRRRAGADGSLRSPRYYLVRRPASSKCSSPGREATAAGAAQQSTCRAPCAARRGQCIPTVIHCARTPLALHAPPWELGSAGWRPTDPSGATLRRPTRDRAAFPAARA